MLCIFRFQCPPCRRVALAGTFNNWSTNANPLDRTGEGWETTINLPPGDYEYCYFVFEDDARPPRSSVQSASKLRLRSSEAEPILIGSSAPTVPDNPSRPGDNYA